jgi:hypothetical protein
LDFIAHFIDLSRAHEEARMFSLDKLKVYDKALASAASLAQHSRSWNQRHAVTDQLLRASESFVLNLADQTMKCAMKCAMKALKPHRQAPGLSKLHSPA